MNLFEQEANPQSIAETIASITNARDTLYDALWWLYKTESWSKTDPVTESWQSLFKLLELPLEMMKWPLEEEKLQGLSAYDKKHLAKAQIDALSVVAPEYRKEVLALARKNSRVNPMTGRKQLSARAIEIEADKKSPSEPLKLKGRLRIRANTISLVDDLGRVTEFPKEDWPMLREFLEDNK